MKIKVLKIQKILFIIILLQLFFCISFGQYKKYELIANGDTINAIDKKNLKQGKWVIKVAALRGEPGYEEEGVFINGKREGIWRRFNLTGDPIAIENYKYGGKHGLQQYFTMMSELVREENWKSYNPDAPYDTIPIYGQGNNEIISFKIVKAEQYSVKHGVFNFYDPGTGRLLKTERYDRGFPYKEPDVTAVVTDDKPKPKVKPKEVQEFEKKNSGKKKVKLREGQTGY